MLHSPASRRGMSGSTMLDYAMAACPTEVQQALLGHP
jgi:hypothetical protein